MMQVRPIQTGESEQFLHLLCEVFSLDYSRAHSIFFNEPMFDLQRKWALFDGQAMISILTTVPLTFGWGRAIGIAGVATLRGHRKKGHAQCLLESVLADAEAKGEGSALLFARDKGLYARVGFAHMDDVVRGEIVGSIDDQAALTMEFDEVKSLYGAWADRHPSRLRRDDQRWNYWNWTLRMCARLQSGYACLEGNIIREVVSGQPESPWPLGRGVEWFGTTHMAQQIGLELKRPQFDLFLMGYNMPDQPQMFMTDQF